MYAVGSPVIALGSADHFGSLTGVELEPCPLFTVTTPTEVLCLRSVRKSKAMISMDSSDNDHTILIKNTAPHHVYFCVARRRYSVLQVKRGPPLSASREKQARAKVVRRWEELTGSRPEQRSNTREALPVTSEYRLQITDRPTIVFGLHGGGITHLGGVTPLRHGCSGAWAHLPHLTNIQAGGYEGAYDQVLFSSDVHAYEESQPAASFLERFLWLHCSRCLHARKSETATKRTTRLDSC